MPFDFVTKTIARCALLAACLTPHIATAQDQSDQFLLDLNVANETEAGDCRLTYVASNQSQTALERAAYQVAVFDGEGIVNRLLVLEFGALIAGKTKVLQFDLAGSACGSISRIVVNNVVACTDATGQEQAMCMSGLTASSRTPIQFGL